MAAVAAATAGGHDTAAVGELRRDRCWSKQPRAAAGCAPAPTEIANARRRSEVSQARLFRKQSNMNQRWTVRVLINPALYLGGGFLTSDFLFSGADRAPRNLSFLRKKLCLLITSYRLRAHRFWLVQVSGCMAAQVPLPKRRIRVEP